MIFAIILLVLLLISLFGNFAQLISQALTFKGGLGNGISREVGPSLDECLLKDNDASSKIAVVTVDGIISGQTVDQAGQQPDGRRSRRNWTAPRMTIGSRP